MKILVTGSNGFIFGNLFEMNFNHDFVGVDKIVNNTFIKNHNFHIADICNQEIMNRIFEKEKPEIVIHGAAETFVDYSLNDPNSFVMSNVLGTQVIINCCLKYNVNKLVYISTDEVYGQLSGDDLPWLETDEINPRNPYSATKAAGELLVKAAGYSHGLNYNITRSSNNFGPYQTFEKLIPKVIKCIKENKIIPIYGEGKQIRDWLYVKDNCNGIMKVVECGKPNEIYNISANNEYKNIDVVNMICGIIGKGQHLINFIEDPRKSHDYRYSIESYKLEKLGWKPNEIFICALENTINWYYSN